MSAARDLAHAALALWSRDRSAMYVLATHLLSGASPAPSLSSIDVSAMATTLPSSCGSSARSSSSAPLTRSLSAGVRGE